MKSTLNKTFNLESDRQNPKEACAYSYYDNNSCDSAFGAGYERWTDIEWYCSDVRLICENARSQKALDLLTTDKILKSIVEHSVTKNIDCAYSDVTGYCQAISIGIAKIFNDFTISNVNYQSALRSLNQVIKQDGITKKASTIVANAESQVNK